MPLLSRLGVNVQPLRSEVQNRINASESIRQQGTYFRRPLHGLFRKRWTLPRRFADKFASVEHLLLGLVADGGDIGETAQGERCVGKRLIAAIKGSAKAAR